MENILPGFRKHHHEIDPEEYERHVYPRAGYVGVPMPYTGQPVGFEHLGSPPKQRLSEMDPKTIAQLGYEGPEGERRKVEAINEVMYQEEVDRSGYTHGIPRRSPERYEYREGYSDGYGRHDNHRYRSERSGHGHSGHGYAGHSSSSHSSSHYPSHYEREDPRYGGHSGLDRHGRPRYAVPMLPVHVDRNVEEDGTVVERVYPDNNVAAAFSRPDYGKIHYGRQESFPETALQEAAAYAQGRRRDYPGRDYPGGDYPGHSTGYAPAYDGTSSYARRPGYEGHSSDYVEERDRRY